MASLNLGENVEIDTELIKKAYSLAVKAHSKSLEKAYNVEESRRSSDPIIIISFSGCWSENGWYDGEPFGVTEINPPKLFPSLRSIGVNENALVNKAFLQRFVYKILGNPDFDREVLFASFFFYFFFLDSFFFRGTSCSYYGFFYNLLILFMP